MITIHIKDVEYYDDASQTFVYLDGGTFRFEHSLEAIFKWEAQWKVPFLNAKHTPEQLRSYLKIMCLDEGLSDLHLVDYVVEDLNAYMNDKRTATTFQNEDKNSPPSRKVLTAEVIYSYMINANIPFEAARWHIDRLMTLLQVIAIQQEKPKMKTRSEILAENKALNAQRLKEYNTKG